MTTPAATPGPQALHMTRLLSISVLALALLGCADGGESGGYAAAEREPAPRGADSAADTQAVQWVVRAESFGTVRFGAPISDVSRAIGEDVRPTYADFATCDYVRPKALPAYTSLMIINDTVMRVDVDSADVRTAEGARVGDTEARVLDIYRGRVSVEPHPYTGPEGHYLVVSSPADTQYRIIFETDGQRITGYRAGRRPAVELIEGCA